MSRGYLIFCLLEVYLDNISLVFRFYQIVRDYFPAQEKLNWRKSNYVRTCICDVFHNYLERVQNQRFAWEKSISARWSNICKVSVILSIIGDSHDKLVSNTLLLCWKINFKRKWKLKYVRARLSKGSCYFMKNFLKNISCCCSKEALRTKDKYDKLISEANTTLDKVFFVKL